MTNTTDRRKADRRQGDRRVVSIAVAVDRRSGDRRTNERRLPNFKSRAGVGGRRARFGVALFPRALWCAKRKSSSLGQWNHYLPFGQTMNFKDLQYALALERRRSFSRAAEECGVAQPTLSAQIRKLESELGVELFERDGRTIRVTPAGELILDQARLALGAMARIEELAQTRADPMVGPIRLGVIPTLAPYLLPGVLGPLQALPAARPAGRRGRHDASFARVDSGWTARRSRRRHRARRRESLRDRAVRGTLQPRAS